MINNKNRVPLEYYRQKFKQLEPREISLRCGLDFNSEKGKFTLKILGYGLMVSWPDFKLEPLDKENCPAVLYGGEAQILVIRYLIEGSHIPHREGFLSYREVPWGEVYNSNFQGRCIKRLAFAFGSRLEAFAQAAESLGGVRLVLGDVSYDLPFFEDLKIRLILRAGDEEFPPTSQILFSDNAVLAFTAEDLAVVGDVVIGALKEVAR